MAALLAALALAAAASARTAAPVRWPYTHLEIGLAGAPGGAAGLAAVAPFGLRYQYLAGGVNTGQDWPHWNPAARSSASTSPSPRRTASSPSSPTTRSASRCRAPASPTRRAPTSATSPTSRRCAAIPHARDVLPARGPSEGPGRAPAGARPLRLHRAARGHGDASTVPAAVASTGIPALRGLPNTAAGFAQAVLALRDRSPPASSSATRSRSGARARTSISATRPPREVDQMAARRPRSTARCTRSFDVTFTELTDRDAGYAQMVDGAGPGRGGAPIDFSHDLRFLAWLPPRASRSRSSCGRSRSATRSPRSSTTRPTTTGTTRCSGCSARAAARTCARSCAPAGSRCSSAAARRRTPTPARRPATGAPTTAATSTPAPAPTTVPARCPAERPGASERRQRRAATAILHAASADAARSRSPPAAKIPPMSARAGRPDAQPRPARARRDLRRRRRRRAAARLARARRSAAARRTGRG